MSYKMMQKQNNLLNFHSGHCRAESKGDATNVRNLMLICAKCNLSMSNNYTIEQFLEKFA